jgi:hypothetical protein
LIGLRLRGQRDAGRQQRGENYAIHERNLN